MGEHGGKRSSSGRPPRRPAARDLELEAGSSAHYEDPVYYEETYRKRTDDVAFYERLARERGGPVLEYGCGNGRLFLPIARALATHHAGRGAACVGVDLSAAMLRDLRARLSAEPAAVRSRARVTRGDMRKVRLGERFRLVLCPFNALLHLYERADLEAFFARVREHLAPGGRFVFDVSVPDASELARDPARAFGVPPFSVPTSEGRKVVRYRERFDYDPMRQVLFVGMEFDPTDGSEGWMVPLAHRQLFPRELEALLHYNGLELVHATSDFEDRAPHKETRTLVLECRAARAFRPGAPRARRR